MNQNASRVRYEKTHSSGFHPTPTGCYSQSANSLRSQDRWNIDSRQRRSRVVTWARQENDSQVQTQRLQLRHIYRRTHITKRVWQQRTLTNKVRGANSWNVWPAKRLPEKWQSKPAFVSSAAWWRELTNQSQSSTWSARSKFILTNIQM